MGRPSKYKPEFPAQARKLCALGATNPELADFFGVHLDTIDEWKNRHPEFSDALKDAKEQLDAKVERRLFERAMGYSHPAIKMFQAGGMILREEYTEHYPPDTTAAIFWLKNRRPEQWREVKAIEMTGKDGGAMRTEGTMNVSGLSTEQLRAIASIAVNAG